MLTAAGLVTSAHAAGLDVAGQPIHPLFQDGRYVEFAIGNAYPENSGTVQSPFGAIETGNVGENLFTFGAAFKDDINDQLSYAFILDTPFARKIDYSDASNPLLASINAEAQTYALTGLLRYKFNENWSVYAGPQILYGRGEINGPDPTTFAPTSIDLGSDVNVGYVAGVAFEIPKYFVRASLTYRSNIDLNLDTTFNDVSIPGLTNTTLTSPESLNFFAQAPVSKKDLLFTRIRYVRWSQTTLTPGDAPGGPDLLNFEDSTTYTIGWAHQFNDNFRGSLAYTDDTTPDPVITGPFGTVRGSKTVSVGATYINGPTEYSALVNYHMLDDTSGTILGLPADFTGNDAFSFGLRVAHRF